MQSDGFQSADSPRKLGMMQIQRWIIQQQCQWFSFRLLDLQFLGPEKVLESSPTLQAISSTASRFNGPSM
jgi:hypothetical protein